MITCLYCKCSGDDSEMCHSEADTRRCGAYAEYLNELPGTITPDVTEKLIRYIAPTTREGSFVFKCVGCGNLEMGRSDQITCSTKCRVRWHRNPRRKEIIESLKSWRVSLIVKAHTDAAMALGFDKEIMAYQGRGEFIYHTAPNGRRLGSALPIRRAFVKLVFEQVKKERRLRKT